MRADFPSLPPLRGLYAVTQDLADSALLLSRAEAALAGGVRWLQYRNKPAPARLRHEQASALAILCRRHAAALIVNDDVELAIAVDAAGVHIGGDDGDPAAVRAAIGRGRVLGISCYDSLDRARRAASAGADYVAFGAVFASSIKPEARRAPLALLGEAGAELQLPVAAIGGITLATAAAVIAAGGDMLAVISDLFDAPDVSRPGDGIEARARAYQRLFTQGPPP